MTEETSFLDKYSFSLNSSMTGDFPFLPLTREKFILSSTIQCSIKNLAQNSSGSDTRALSNFTTLRVDAKQLGTTAEFRSSWLNLDIPYKVIIKQSSNKREILKVKVWSNNHFSHWMFDEQPQWSLNVSKFKIIHDCALR